MKAYIVILRLFEKDEDRDEPSEGTDKKIITISSSLADASSFAVRAYEEADGPMTDGFHWEAIHAEEIEGKVALPAMRGILPKT